MNDWPSHGRSPPYLDRSITRCELRFSFCIHSYPQSFRISGLGNKFFTLHHPLFVDAASAAGLPIFAFGVSMTPRNAKASPSKFPVATGKSFPKM